MGMVRADERRQQGGGQPDDSARNRIKRTGGDGPSRVCGAQDGLY